MSEENVLKRIRRYLFLAVALLMLCLTACGGNNVSPTQIQNDEGTEQGIAFPYELENGKLIVNSLFPSSINNPDCNGEYADDVATLEVVNVSEQFLKEAHITAKLQDGTLISFKITNLPAGKTVWAFASDNTSVDLQPLCEELECAATFSDEPVMRDELYAEVNGTEITVFNTSAETLENVTVYCHCLFDDVYFGGLTYNYSVAAIPANGSKNISADDLVIGDAEVVWIN